MNLNNTVFSRDNPVSSQQPRHCVLASFPQPQHSSVAMLVLYYETSPGVDLQTATLSGHMSERAPSTVLRRNTISHNNTVTPSNTVRPSTGDQPSASKEPPSHCRSAPELFVQSATYSATPVTTRRVRAAQITIVKRTSTRQSNDTPRHAETDDAAFEAFKKIVMEDSAMVLGLQSASLRHFMRRPAQRR